MAFKNNKTNAACNAVYHNKTQSDFLLDLKEELILDSAAFSLTCQPQKDIRMDSVLMAQVNSLVGDYLTSLNPKLAAKFLKETKAGPLPSGSPSMKDLVKHFNDNPPKKRKLEMNGHTNGHAKKAKKVSLFFMFVLYYWILLAVHFKMCILFIVFVCRTSRAALKSLIPMTRRKQNQ